MNQADVGKPAVQAAGLVLFTRSEPSFFLLLRHQDRWDLPKGHTEPGEELLETALRETEEETGIDRQQLQVDPGFRYELRYEVKSKKRGSYPKQVTYFLAYVSQQPEVILTEHIGFEWFPWPTGAIQQQTIDPLLQAVKRYFDESDPAAN